MTTKTLSSATIRTASRVLHKRSFLERLLQGDCIGDPCQFMAGGNLQTGTIVKVYQHCILARAASGTMYSIRRK